MLTLQGTKAGEMVGIYREHVFFGGLIYLKKSMVVKVQKREAFMFEGVVFELEKDKKEKYLWIKEN